MDGDVSIQPMLTVNEGIRAVEFYKDAFGATVSYLVGDPEGEIVARLVIGGAEFWVTDGPTNPYSLGGSPVRIVLVVPDPDAVCVQAKAAGAQVQSELEDAHGWRTGRVVDPFGHYWEIAKRLDPLA